MTSVRAHGYEDAFALDDAEPKAACTIFFPNLLAPSNRGSRVQVSTENGFLDRCDAVRRKKHAHIAVNVLLLAINLHNVGCQTSPDLFSSFDQFNEILI